MIKDSVIAKILVLCFLSLVGIHTYGHNFFSFDKVSKTEFDAAFQNYDKFNFPLFTDTIIPNEAVSAIIIQDVKNRFERDGLSVEDLEVDDYDSYFSAENLLQFNELQIQAFLVPKYPDWNVYCYDATSGSFIGEMLLPITRSPKGIIVGQVGYDCDWPLNLEFYRYSPEGKYLYTILKIFAPEIYSEFLYSDRVENPYFLFWGSENDLFFSAPSFNVEGEPVNYYKITINL